MHTLASIGPAKSVLQIAPTAEQAEHDLLINPREPAAAGTYTLTDHGGSTIKDPRLVLVFLGGLGAWWGDWGQLAQFSTDIMTRGYLDPLEAYGSGSGTFWGSVDGPAVPAHVRDSDLQAVLKRMIAANQVPAPDGHTLYALVLPQGVSVSFDDGSGSNCTSFCGYHSAIDDRTFYAVHPAPQCGAGGGCTGGRDPFDAFTMVLAHEIAEACTDAVPGRGWFQDSDGSENADLVAWIDKRFGPWWVQGFWTNEAGNTVGAWRDAVQPGPPPRDVKAEAIAIAKDTAAAFGARKSWAQRSGAWIVARNLEKGL